MSEETPPRRSTTTALTPTSIDSLVEDDYYTAPPPHSPSEASASSSGGPPPFSSLDFVFDDDNRPKVTESGPATLPVFAPPPPLVEDHIDPAPSAPVVADTKASFSESKGDGLGKGSDDGEPPPPYTEGYSPLESFSYVMAAAGGASSIITQVQQTGGPPINTLGGKRA